MNNVLVTDGRSRASLAIVRSLGRKGIKVTSGEAFVCSSFYSKYADKKLVYPAPDKQPDLFLEKIMETIKKDTYDVIIPVRDDANLILSKHKKELSHFTKVPIADYDTLMKGRDKAQTLKIAIDNDIPCPQTCFIEDDSELNEIMNELKFPVVIKPNRSSGSRGIEYVQSPKELAQAYCEVQNKYGEAMIQEFIPQGGAYGVSMLFNHGEPRAIFTHKRLREYPNSGGPSTLRESVRFPEIEEYATTLLETLNWHGVAMVEFRVDPRDGKPKLMEINPRFWGSLQLATYSGVDFPYLLYKMAIDGDVEPVFEYKTGVKVRWLLLGDILWFLGIQNSNKLKALPEFLKFRGMGYDVLPFRDPIPALGTILEGLKSMTLKERRNHAFDRGW
jgi:predicted ATP-grasp superfamily ATP-dependent carboligase